MPADNNLQRRLLEAYKQEVERVNPHGNGIITSPGRRQRHPEHPFTDNSRLYLPPMVFNRFAVTWEINDGILAPRFSAQPANMGLERIIGKGEFHR